MTLQDIYQYLETLQNKNIEGGTFSHLEFNAMLSKYNYKVFDDAYFQYKKLVLEGIPAMRAWEMTRVLEPFKKEIDGIGMLGGKYTFADPYADHIMALLIENSGEYRNATEVSINEFYGYKVNVLHKDLYKNPVFYTGIDATDYLYFNILPDSINSIKQIVYLQRPVTPVYDVCMCDATYRLIYMPPGSYIADDGGNDYLYDSGGVKLWVYPVSHYTPVTTPYTSISVEHSFNSFGETELLRNMLYALGVKEVNQVLIQSNAEKR